MSMQIKFTFEITCNTNIITTLAVSLLRSLCFVIHPSGIVGI